MGFITVIDQTHAQHNLNVIDGAGRQNIDLTIEHQLGNIRICMALALLTAFEMT